MCLHFYTCKICKNIFKNFWRLKKWTTYNHSTNIWNTMGKTEGVSNQKNWIILSKYYLITIPKQYALCIIFYLIMACHLSNRKVDNAFTCSLLNLHLILPRRIKCFIVIFTLRNFLSPEAWSQMCADRLLLLKNNYNTKLLRGSEL